MTINLRALLLFVPITFACESGRAAEPFAPEPGFKSLFNGTDLSGWRYGKEPLGSKTATHDGRFLVQDSAIVVTEGKGAKELTTIAEFNGDFELKLEFRAAAKADSGVYVRGPQLQVRDFVRRNEHAHLKTVFKNDGWNELHIVVRANTTVTLAHALAKTDRAQIVIQNGKATALVNDKEVDGSAVTIATGVGAVCRLNGVVFEPNFKPGPKGGIGLQAETGKFEYRRIRIKERS